MVFVFFLMIGFLHGSVLSPIIFISLFIANFKKNIAWLFVNITWLLFSGIIWIVQIGSMEFESKAFFYLGTAIGIIFTIGRWVVYFSSFSFKHSLINAHIKALRKEMKEVKQSSLNSCQRDAYLKIHDEISNLEEEIADMQLKHIANTVKKLHRKTAYWQ